MTDKTKAKLALAWVILTLALSAIACDNSTSGQCPRACNAVDMAYKSSTATTCLCLNGDTVVELW